MNNSNGGQLLWLRIYVQMQIAANVDIIGHIPKYCSSVVIYRNIAIAVLAVCSLEVAINRSRAVELHAGTA